MNVHHFQPRKTPRDQFYDATVNWARVSYRELTGMSDSRMKKRAEELCAPVFALAAKLKPGWRINRGHLLEQAVSELQNLQLLTEICDYDLVTEKIEPIRKHFSEITYDAFENAEPEDLYTYARLMGGPPTRAADRDPKNG